MERRLQRSEEEIFCLRQALSASQNQCSYYKERCERLEADHLSQQAQSSAALAEVRGHVAHLTEALASMDLM